MTLVEHVEHYVKFRRALGHAYLQQARCLQDYATYAEARGDRFVRSSTVLEWASTTPSPRQAQVKLRYVCDLASVLHADDDRHEVPDRDALGKARSRRPSPHLLSLTEIVQIMDAALELPPTGSITPLTFHYILGLIAATGLRRSEATGLLPAGGPDGGWFADPECEVRQAPSRPAGWQRPSGHGRVSEGEKALRRVRRALVRALDRPAHAPGLSLDRLRQAGTAGRASSRARPAWAAPS